jgi:rubredoxin
LRCTRCNGPWYESIDECYFCGELRYYVYTCPNCGLEFSPQGNQQCTACPDQDLKELCINRNCPTRTNVDIFRTPTTTDNHDGIYNNLREMANLHQQGVFGKDTSFSLSLTYCTNCGNTSNNYEIIKVFPYYDHNISIQDFIADNGIQQDDMILFKRKQNDQRHYDFVIYNGNIPNPNYNNFVNEDGIAEIIERVFMYNQH